MSLTKAGDHFIHLSEVRGEELPGPVDLGLVYSLANIKCFGDSTINVGTWRAVPVARVGTWRAVPDGYVNRVTKGKSKRIGTQPLISK